ncbi:3-hydroxyacyl-ACP dehydratase FabZ [Thermithiobacillus plumbiphilus]|uniref:3-hydroxyacyl-[acyl-carrier-protein] dehydratase FabZ n=1 Tax=Thermithiobacillus plumbiphilus TaxID=1729899 RepID=A0ABU9D683_9PROT
MVLDIAEILKRLPHRYPFLLVDRVLGFEMGQSLHALKNVTINEPFFPGHFPGTPVMPGVLIIESLAQAAGILAFLSEDKYKDDALVYFAGIEKARFRKPVTPGDQLHLHVTVERRRSGIWQMGAEARVEDNVVASATLMATLKAVDK